LDILSSDAASAIKQAVLNSLQGYESDDVAAKTIAAYNAFSADSKLTAQSLLASRPQWTLQLLDQVAQQKIPKASIGHDTILKMLLHNDATIKGQVQQAFGEQVNATSEQLQARITSLVQIISEAAGNPYDGKPLFLQHCGKCHQLFTDGGNIGPDLTSFKRDDLQNMLLNIANPSISIRKGFENYAILTLDGRVLTGFIDDQDSRVVVLQGPDGQRTVVNRQSIDEMHAIARSIMPEGILKMLSPQQIRDLFAYLRSSQPLP
jgi:putative heme-binding domain-containing protein